MKSKLIAITGKGGVGKTTLCALLIKNLLSTGKTPVLAIDADPNSCLDAALGVSVSGTVGRAREDVRTESQTNVNISKKELLELKIQSGLAEANGFDLITMGRPEGEGCYCYANNILKDIITEISSKYPYVILDNEAGLENLSRRIVQKTDLMIFVSDASNSGMQTLLRLYELAIEMKITYSKLAIVINKIKNDKMPQKITEIQEKTKADIVIGLPDDNEIFEFAQDNKNYLDISNTNPVFIKINELLKIDI